jgi:hypothetical protein
MPGIPKLRKERHPERAEDNGDRFFSRPLRLYVFERFPLDKSGASLYKYVVARL